MISRALFVLVLILISSVYLAPLRADGPAKTQSSRTVGRVYGKAVTSADIGLTAPINPAVRFDATDTARWELMGRIMQTFGGPILDRFVVQRKIDAKADEIEAFRKYWRKINEESRQEMEGQLAKVTAELASPDLPDKTRTQLAKERARLKGIVSSMRDPLKDDEPDALARAFIVAWKTERELQSKYGGRLIHQQLGVEALDARRLLFEEAEKKGDLKFDDAGVRHLFYYYANMKHIFADAKDLEVRRWFLGDAR